MRISLRFAGAVALAVLVASLADPGMVRAQSVQSTDRHVFSFGSVPAGFAADVAAAGGSVVRAHEAIGLVVTSGLSDDAAATLGGDAVRDVILQWLGDPSDLQTEALTGPGGQAHDPTTAFFFPLQWDMQIINADDAWDAGFSGSSAVRVAVIDSGIDPFHIDLAGLIDTSASVAFTPSFSPGFFGDPSIPDWADDRYHGTHVAGTIVTNGLGTSGVAPHTTLIAVKALNIFGSGSFSNIIAGIMHSADVGADVINMSLGVPGGVPKNLPGAGQLIAALNKAVNYANRNGSLVVSAAGNDGADMQHAGNAAFVPCESGSSMCVSATQIFDGLAGYSNFGNSINVAAPGGDIVTGSTASDFVLAPCSSVSVFLPIFVGFSCSTSNYLFLIGTSMATPHVAGAAALLDAQSGGAMNPAQLRAALQQTATDLGKMGNDPAYGKGRIDVCYLVGCD